MDLKEKFIEVLTQSGLISPSFDLEKTSSGKIQGYVISSSFEGMQPLDRQNLVWDFIEKYLPDQKNPSIYAFLAITPQEYED